MLNCEKPAWKVNGGRSAKLWSKCESTTEFFLANIHYYFVKSESLGLVAAQASLRGREHCTPEFDQRGIMERGSSVVVELD